MPQFESGCRLQLKTAEFQSSAVFILFFHVLFFHQKQYKTLLNPFGAQVKLHLRAFRRMQYRSFKDLYKYLPTSVYWHDPLASAQHMPLSRIGRF
jgi:hypothetical protein